MHTLLSLGRLEEAARLVPQCRKGLAEALHKQMRTMLRGAIRRFEKLAKAAVGFGPESRRRAGL
jgi:hypothetical protein